MKIFCESEGKHFFNHIENCAECQKNMTGLLEAVKAQFPVISMFIPKQAKTDIKEIVKLLKEKQNAV
jgi:hypothetical protein